MKTEITNQLEQNIRYATLKMGVFGCFEVTIGFGGKERVDYLTYDTKNIFRCYEIKSSLADFNSKHKKTFCGHYNYYVLTQELYDKVAQDIPNHIGVYVGGNCVKNPKKQNVSLEDMDVLKSSMIRSLARDSNKLYDLGHEHFVSRLKSDNKNLRRKHKHYMQLKRACTKYDKEYFKKVIDKIEEM